MGVPVDINSVSSPVTRASAASKWWYCSEAAWLEQLYPDTQGDEAREGEAAHEMSELVLTVQFGIDELINRPASNGAMMVDEMVEHVQMYVDHVQSRGIGYWVEQEILIENPAVMPGRVTGKCDGAAFNFDEATGMLYIDDFKYGHGPVEVFENRQLLIYAIGMRYKIARVIKGVTMSIIQPRGYHHQGPIRSWTITEAELIGYEHQLIERMKAVHDPNRKCQSGLHCQHCKRLAFCETAKAAGMNAIDVIHAALPDTDTPEQVAMLMDTFTHAQKTIKHLLTAMNARGESMILNGQPIPGYGYEPGTGHAKFIDENKAKETAQTMGVSLIEEKTITPAEAKRRGLPKAIVDQQTYTPSTAPRLVKRDVSTLFKKAFENG